jgi:natural product biosynthesis luciferase-like monooxygenase protein/amino acid adenylation domain-containing protein
MQNGLLFHSEYEQEPGYYIEQLVCRLHEAVEVTLLLQSWQQVVQQHPVLRTSFYRNSAAQLQQVVYSKVQVPFTQQDWQGLSRAERDQNLSHYLSSDRQTKIDITTEPLMRLALFQLEEEEYILVWTFHHALLDGRSMAIVLEEVFALYDAAYLDKPCSLRDRRPYQDYIDWLQQQTFSQAEPFWRKSLQGFTTPTQIPVLIYGSILSDDSISRYGSHHIQLSSELTNTLKALAQEHQLTLNTLVQAAWSIILMRYSGETDVVFGATRACRYSSIEAVDSMVGLFINTLPIRVQVNEDTTLLPFLKQLRSQWVAMRDYEHTPLVKVQEWSDVPKGTALFNSILVFDHDDLNGMLRKLGGKWTQRDVELLEQMHYPLVLNAYGGSTLKLGIQFDRYQFDDEVILQILGQLQTLLQSFPTDHQRRVGKLPLSSFSCFVIGEGALALSCLETLLEKGCQVLGIYSTDSTLQRWCETHGISFTSARHAFQEQLFSVEYDYLFSVNNVQWIIPDEVTTRARRATINYHDSPLPKYAGLYATSWALMNGEIQHAVTWHEVVAEVDAGQIFKQKTVPILEGDTAFSLNSRCFDAAIDTFNELVEELLSDSAKSYAQDLSQRTYFGSSDRPTTSAVLSFDRNGRDLCNLVQALNFGSIRNPLGLPKVWLPGGVVAVESAHFVSAAHGIPGEVLQLDSDGLCVATTDGAVRLNHLTTLDGKDICAKCLVEDYGTQVGIVLPILDAGTKDAISQRNAAICRYEQVWTERLMQLITFKHPYLPTQLPNQPLKGVLQRYPVSLAGKQAEPKTLLTLFAAYCAKLSTEPEFDLGLQTESQRSVAPEIFAQRVPIHIQTHDQESFSQFKERLEASLDQISRLGSFRYSLLRRYPELRDRMQDYSLPVAIVVAPNPQQLNWQHLDALMAFVAYEDGSAPELVHAGILNDVYSDAIVQQLQSLITVCTENPESSLEQLSLLSTAEQKKILVEWNQTETSFPENRCIHELFEIQVLQNPDAIALTFAKQQLTYQELNTRANQLAHYLRSHGVGPDVLVGLYMERSLEMMVGLLAIQKAGGAYLPLDPNFPADRLQFMVQDSQAPVILSQHNLVSKLGVETNVCIIAIDTVGEILDRQPTVNPESGVTPSNLSYVIYTSGSTGRPKGVMVEHRNVVNFFSGMDSVIRHDPPGVWLAVTSLSFDISVLELFWTLARGFKVVIYDAKEERSQAPVEKLELQNAARSIDFSLFYFSSCEENQDATVKYRLLMEGVQFGDTNGFKAVWTPERHFHAFGGLYPNPAVTSAAIAATTKQIQIRAGSCVSPLHSTIRIAEDWSLVDNLSGGRVGISFAAGWQPNDFVLRPETFENRKDIMFQQIEEVQALWRGDPVTYPNGKGDPVAVKTLPRPIQSELPVWVTAAGNPETFRMAGAKGFHILTHLLGQNLEELAEKIAIYRQAWSEQGHPAQGTVTLMLHTFVGTDNDEVREIVRQPMRQYLSSSLDLIKQAAWSFPTFKQKTTNDQGLFSMAHLSPQDVDEVLDFSFERYFETSGLFGTVETCLQIVDRIKSLDVDEIACLIDYGVDTEAVLDQLSLLNDVKKKSNLQSSVAVEPLDNSVAGLIQQHQVTHLQCTPSMARMLIADETNRAAMGRLQNLMVGGEAFPESLAIQLKQVIPGQIHNMYGPTETTIWSATHTLTEVDGVVPIGTAIANTELYVLDQKQQPLPVGIPGELLIGGKGVTRGYLNRPELTQERFIPNPFSDDPTERLYRTGDLVCYRPDGCLEFLGRIDFQVKVRGYRIELGEIETILSRHEAIREAVIVVREDTPGDQRLVAYVIPQPEHQPSNASLRDFLLAQLPEYMVPSHFVLLEAFPLTPNKKVDRKALPAPTLVAPDETIPEQNAPQTSTERRLIAIWQKILQVSAVGIDDNFFDLGGNSLIAVTLIAEIRSIFNVDLPLITLFRAPTIRAIAQRIGTSHPAAAQPTEVAASIKPSEYQITPEPENRFQPFPLTGLQQAYWVGRSGEVEMGQVASHSYIELESPFDLERLQEAWQRLIDRHDMMRAIVLSDGTQQVLQEVTPYQFRVLDLRGQDTETVDAWLEQVRDHMSHQILPSDQYPLFDIQATLLDQQRVRLHVSLDALVFDGWSIGIVYQEWATLYHNPAADLEPLEISFRDYVLAERSLIHSEEYQRSQEYWRNRIDSLPLGPDLPIAKQPSALKNGQFVRREAVVNASLWQQVKAQSAKLGITPPGILAAVYAEVLSLWSRERHFCINVPSFNRFPLHSQVNRLIGEAASFTVLEVDNTGDAPFAERAKRLQEQLWSDLDHRFFSGVEILRELAIAQNRLSGSLMPVVFTAIPEDESGQSTYATVQAEALGEVVFAINQTSQVWLDNHVFEHQGALHCHWDTVEELFPEGLSQNLLEAFTQLLQLLATEPELWQQSWSTIMRRVMAAIEQPFASVGEEQSIPEILLHDLIAAQVSHRPDQSALITTRRTLSYQELYSLANRWGRYLRDLGAQPNQPIAIVMEKGWEQVVAALGVLHSGAPYLPVDVTVGKERLDYLLNNANVKLVLTQSWLDERLEYPAGIQRICVDQETLSDVIDSPLEPIQKPDDLAFVLYTSGSTGLPKGVMIAHQGLVNAIVSTQEKFAINSQDRVLALTALHHDMSIFDVFGVLGAGGTLVIPDASGRRDPAHWSKLIMEHQITVWNSVPAMLEMLLEYAGDRTDVIPPTLRLAFLGGDWIPLTIPKRLAKLADGAKVVSVGGPTETTLWNIWYPVEAIDPTWKSIPYGRPIPNTSYYILNDALVECPTWVAGEMCVSGVGLAKGYWQDPEKTEAKFILHPKTGERIYRTGDLGRFRPDGTIEFVGRVDFQFKINGQRIEPGEIEAALLQHQSIQAAIVTAHPDRRGKKLLVAYVIPEKRQDLDPDHLRTFLANRLPEHMIPATVVPLEQFPLTRNGKVDRRALPEPFATEQPPSNHQPQKQSSRIQTTIAQIVSEILQIESLDLNANLLGLGANSLDMVRIGNQLEREFKSRPRIDELFRLQSVQALVDYYEQRNTQPVSFEGNPEGEVVGHSSLLSSYKVILDPIEREKFKKTRPGVRRDLSELPSIQLSQPMITEELIKKYKERSSYRKFLLNPIPFGKFSQFLSCLSQIKLDGQPKFLYASPGGLNPTQVYLHVKPGRIENVPAGVYYYQPEDHQLITLTPHIDIDRTIHIPFINTPMFDECAFSIFFIADLDAVGPSYGDRGIHFVTLESGIMAHQLEVYGPSYDIGLCQVGSIAFDQIRPWFKLKDTHILIHSTLGGYIDSTRSSRADVSNTAGQSLEKTASELLERVKTLSTDQARDLVEAYLHLNQHTNTNGLS